jgi:hypothetical protein
MQIFDYLPETMLSRVANLKDFGRCLVLDKWTANSDGRQAIFARAPRCRRYRASLCCDFSYVMTEPSVRLGRGFQST